MGDMRARLNLDGKVHDLIEGKVQGTHLIMAHHCPIDDNKLLKIIKKIGEGGYGSVYLVQHSTYGDVVMKQIRDASDIGKNDLKNLLHEANILTKLRHPNIVTFYEGRFDSEICGLFLEFLKFGSVDSFLEEFSVSIEWKMQIIFDISLAMCYLHEHQPSIIHGDLKCQNILIGNDFHAKVCDFGLSRIYTITQSKTGNKIRGTLAYIAPEYFREPRRKITEKFDVYSYAVSVWEIFSQKRAYYDFSKKELIPDFVMKGERPLIEDMKLNITKPEIKLIQDCWHQEEKMRPKFTSVRDSLRKELLLISDEIRTSEDDLVEQAQKKKREPYAESERNKNQSDKADSMYRETPHQSIELTMTSRRQENQQSDSTVIKSNQPQKKQPLNRPIRIEKKETQPQKFADVIRSIRKENQEIQENQKQRKLESASSVNLGGSDQMKMQSDTLTQSFSSTELCEPFVLLSNLDVLTILKRDFGMHDFKHAMNPEFNMIYSVDGKDREPGFRSYYFEEPIYHGGEPYYCPNGWRRFAVDVGMNGQEFEKAYDDWHVAYHGTAIQNILPILENGIRADWDPFFIKPGEGAVYVSPSIEYAGFPYWAKLRRINGKYIQVVLMLRVRPTLALGKHHGTIGGTYPEDEQMDPNFSNNELEWAIKWPLDGMISTTDGILVYGLMFRVTDEDPKNLPQNTWWAKENNRTLFEPRKDHQK